MSDPMPAAVPDSLAYSDGRYVPRWLGWAQHRETLRGRRIVTRILYAILLPRFTIRPPRGTGVLSTTGRRTGKTRRTFVKAARVGDMVYLVSILGTRALWVKNIQNDPRVRLRLPDRTYAGIGRELRDRAEYQTAYHAFCDNVYPIDYAENVFHRGGIPTRARIIELHRAWFEGGTPLVVDLEPARRT